MVERIPGIYEITLYDVEKGVTEMRIFIVKGNRGERSLMIDAGFGNTESLATMEVALDELGIPYDELDVFLTHKHHDHCGLATTYARKGTRLFMNPEEERHSYDCLYFRMGEEAAKEQQKVLRSVGISEDKTPEVWKKYMEMNEWVGKKREEWVYMIRDYPYNPVKEGQVFEYGPYRFQAVRLRGHTLGQMGLYDPDKKILFCADQVINRINPIVGTTHADEHLLELYFESLMDFKEKYQDCQIFPAHNGPIRNVSSVVDRIAFAYLKKMDQVKRKVEERGTKKTVWEVARAVYGIGKIPDNEEDFMQVKAMISKTFSCLEYLYGIEMVQRVYEDGQWMYFTAT